MENQEAHIIYTRVSDVSGHKYRLSYLTSAPVENQTEIVFSS